MKRSSAYRFIFMQIQVIFIRMVSHLDSLWNRGILELENSLLSLSHVQVTFFTYPRKRPDQASNTVLVGHNEMKSESSWLRRRGLPTFFDLQPKTGHFDIFYLRLFHLKLIPVIWLYIDHAWLKVLYVSQNTWNLAKTGNRRLPTDSPALFIPSAPIGSLKAFKYATVVVFPLQRSRMASAVRW